MKQRVRLERGKIREPVGRFFQLRRSCLQPSAKRPCVPPTGQLPRDPARLSPEGFHIPLGDLRWPLRTALPKNTTGLSTFRKWPAPARHDPSSRNYPDFYHESRCRANVSLAPGSAGRQDVGPTRVMRFRSPVVSKRRYDPRNSSTPCVINARNGGRINLPCHSGRDKRTGMRLSLIHI